MALAAARVRAHRKALTQATAIANSPAEPHDQAFIDSLSEAAPNSENASASCWTAT
jgi:hypothetical protein